MELSSKQRAWLRSKASALDAIFQIGKDGVGENMLKQIDDTLAAREMIKCRVLESCEYSPKEAAEGIATAIDATVVTVIGSKLVLFKVSPVNRQYDLLNLKMIEKEKAEIRKPSLRPVTGKNRKPYKVIKKK